MSQHYTATVEVTKTSHEPATIDRYSNVTAQEKREVAELARLVIRADSLPALVEKIGAHVALITE